MPLNPIRSGQSSVRFWIFSSLLAMLAAGCIVKAQTGDPSSEKKSSIESHFRAAQQAQHDQDYALAEREYRAVLTLDSAFAEVHMNLGLLYELQDRSSEAMAEFRRALKIKPGLAGANFFLGVDYCKSGQGAKAVAYLQAALHAEPGRRDIWLWLATAQEISGDLPSEVVTLRRALELQPKDADVFYLLGSAYERLGKKAVAHLQKIAPGSSRSEQLLAESYAASSEWPSAVIRFQNALAASPDRAGLHAELGEVFLRAGRLNQAMQEFNNELKGNPANLRALVRRGEASLIEGSVAAALQDWGTSLAMDVEQTERILGLREAGFGDSALEQLPDSARDEIQKLAGDLQRQNSPAGHMALAFLAEQQGNSLQMTSEAELAASAGKKDLVHMPCTEADVNSAVQNGAFSKVLSCAEKVLSSPSTARFRVAVASALLEAGQPDTALRTLDELPPAEAKSAEVAYWRARCYEKLATASYLRLYQADPDSYRCHQLMGDLESAKGNDSKAIEQYRAAIALKPSLPNLHYSLGHILWKDLKIPEARLEFEAELKLNPRHSGALDELGDTYLLEHQPDKASPFLLRALAADSRNTDIHRDLGTAYSELGDYRNAEEHLRIAASVDHDGSVHYKLGKVYQSLGQKEKAAREFALSSALNRESHQKLEKQTERVGAITNSTQDP